MGYCKKKNKRGQNETGIEHGNETKARERKWKEKQDGSWKEKGMNYKGRDTTVRLNTHWNQDNGELVKLK